MGCAQSRARKKAFVQASERPAITVAYIDSAWFGETAAYRKLALEDLGIAVASPPSAPAGLAEDTDDQANRQLQTWSSFSRVRPSSQNSFSLHQMNGARFTRQLCTNTATARLQADHARVMAAQPLQMQLVLPISALTCEQVASPMASVMKAMGQPVGRHQVGGRSTGGLLTFHCQEQDIGQQMVVYKPAALPTPERRPAVIVSVGVLGYTRGLLTPVVFQMGVEGQLSVFYHQQVAAVELKATPAAVYSPSGSRSALQEPVSLAERRVTQMILNRTRVICHEASLPIPSDRSFPMTSLLAAGDLKPTRAYEGHVPRLSLLSWCASSSPAQDWIACAATRSLPGNERTLWLSPSLPTHPPINQLLASLMKAMGQPVGRQVGGRFTGGLLTFQYEEQDIGQEMVVYKPAALSNPERRPALIVSVGVLGYAWGLLTPVVFQGVLSDPRMSLTPPQAAEDPKRTRAYQGHVPSLSLLSWCASSSPTQDWMAYVAHPSLPGNERTPSLCPSPPTPPFMTQLLGSLRTPCDHRLSFTSLQTAGDPKLTRAYERQFLRLSTASWPASASPAQDWVAYVALASLTGNEHPPWPSTSLPTPPSISQLLMGVEGQLSVVSHRQVAPTGLKALSAAVPSPSGSRSALQERIYSAERRAVQMMLNKTRAILQEASLRTTPDRRLPLTASLAADDLKLTRAHEDQFPRLSTPSWCASSAPAQDWFAHIATPSPPGIRRTPWLVVNIMLPDASPLTAPTSQQPRLELVTAGSHVLSGLLDKPLPTSLPIALPAAMPTASRGTLRLPSDLSKSGLLTTAAHHHEPSFIVVDTGLCRVVGDVQRHSPVVLQHLSHPCQPHPVQLVEDISRPLPLHPGRPHPHLIHQPVAIHISTFHFGCSLGNLGNHPAVHLQAYPDHTPGPPLPPPRRYLPMIPVANPNATPHSGLTPVSSPSPYPLLPCSTPASPLRLPSSAVPRPICSQHSLLASALSDGRQTSPSQLNSALSASDTSPRALFSPGPSALLRPVSSVPSALTRASSLSPAIASSQPQLKEQQVSDETAAKSKPAAATEVPVASRRSHQARRSLLPATDTRAAAHGLPPGLPRPPPGLLPPIIEVTGTYLERHRPTMTRLRRRYDTLPADHVFFKCDDESDEEQAPAVQKPDPFMAKEWLHDLCPGRDQHQRSQPTRQQHSPIKARTAAATAVVRPARPGSATSTAVPAHSTAEQSSSTAGPTAHRSRRRRPHHREGGRTSSAVAAQTPAGGQAGVPGGSSSAASQRGILSKVLVSQDARLDQAFCQQQSWTDAGYGFAVECAQPHAAAQQQGLLGTTGSQAGRGDGNSASAVKQQGHRGQPGWGSDSLAAYRPADRRADGTGGPRTLAFEPPRLHAASSSSKTICFWPQ